MAMGVGIWSMHFIAMLAFHLPAPITYGPAALPLGRRRHRRVGARALHRQPAVPRTLALGGSPWMGPAISGMHYIGMAALNADARLEYPLVLVVASVAIAVLASLAGLELAHRFRSDETRRTRLARVGSALVFGAAIAGMHYTGMAAARFSTPGHTGRPGGGVLATGELAAGVGIGALLILGTGLLGDAGVKVGRCLPRNIPATRAANRPNVFPSASTRYHFSCTSKGFCMYVDIVLPRSFAIE